MSLTLEQLEARARDLVEELEALREEYVKRLEAEKREKVLFDMQIFA